MELDRVTVRRLQGLVVIIGSLVALFITSGVADSREPTGRPASGNDTEQKRPDTCVECHSKQADTVVSLFSNSSHAGAGKSCVDCHGGNPEAADQKGAHGENFVGAPQDTAGSLKMCGSCHRAQATAYKASRHFSDKQNVPRPDCVRCHGAHAVGTRSADFSWPYFCSGCHGLEYLPELTGPVKTALATNDEIRARFRKITESGQTVSPDARSRKAEIARLTGEAVHSTSKEKLADGSESREKIRQMTRELNQILDSVKPAK